MTNPVSERAREAAIDLLRLLDRPVSAMLVQDGRGEDDPVVEAFATFEQPLLAEIARLREALTEAAGTLETMIPRNVNIHHPRWNDATALPVDVTLGELRRVESAAKAARAALEPRS